MFDVNIIINYFKFIYLGHKVLYESENAHLKFNQKK